MYNSEICFLFFTFVSLGFIFPFFKIKCYIHFEFRILEKFHENGRPHLTFLFPGLENNYTSKFVVCFTFSSAQCCV